MAYKMGVDAIEAWVAATLANKRAEVEHLKGEIEALDSVMSTIRSVRAQEAKDGAPR